MTATIATDWLGRVIDGRYVVESVLGHGGMGVVLAARHKFTRARVAVKMVRSDLGLDAEIEARFLAEARVPTAIDHRGVVKTLDAGKTVEGELYIVMELLNGRSLREQMTSGLGGPSTRRIGMELLDVLAAAHARAIIHRDVKPENVFLVEPELSVKLLDFGITKLLAGTASVLPRTAAGALLGTLAYMAPEQLADASSVDARADLWSVSVILYEMLSGRRPYRATTVEDMFAVLMKTEPDPIRVAMPSATPDIEAFFARALAREPRQRFSSAAEMAMAFAQLPVAASIPAVATPAGGNMTVATGFAATATPERGLPGASAPIARPRGGAPIVGAPEAAAPVLTPFAGTPAVVLTGPAFAATQRPAPHGPPAVANRTFAAPIPPSVGTRSAAPAGVARTATPRSHRRLPWVLGAISTLALGAAIVLAVGSGRQPGSSPPSHDDDAALAGPASPPEPATPAAPLEPTAAPEPVTVQEPRLPPKRPPSPAPSTSRPPRAGGAQPKVRPLDPHAGSAATLPHQGSGASSPPEPAKPSPASPPVAPPPAELCAAGCKLLASCRLGSQTCEADCAQHGTLNSCLQKAGNDCNRFAACWFASSCRGVTPHGQHSCSATMDCEARCSGDTSCICRCVGDLSINHAATLLGYNGCALPCRDADCIAKRCGPQTRSCKSE
jgi:serine/threonine-protein kinase